MIALSILSTLCFAMSPVTVKAAEVENPQNIEEVQEQSETNTILNEVDLNDAYLSQDLFNNFLIFENAIITSAEYDTLCKIVEAEAGNQDLDGRILVANVILNRVKSEKFPNSINEVVFAKGQFSPAKSGSIKAVPDEITIKAVNDALNGADYSEGALYFRSTKSNGNWGKLELVLSHGAHKFYK